MRGGAVRALRKLAALAHLLSGAVVIGLVAAFAWSPLRGALGRAVDLPVARIALGACLAVLALGTLAASLAALLARRPPSCVHPGGDPDIEVSVAALESIARTAAEREDVMVESVRGRIGGKDRSRVRFTIEAIAFTDRGLAELARRVQSRVAAACDAMLGEKGVTAVVRFLPSKTTVISKEAPREQAQR